MRKRTPSIHFRSWEQGVDRANGSGQKQMSSVDRIQLRTWQFGADWSAPPPANPRPLADPSALITAGPSVFRRKLFALRWSSAHLGFFLENFLHQLTSFNWHFVRGTTVWQLNPANDLITIRRKLRWQKNSTALISLSLSKTVRRFKGQSFYGHCA